MEAKDKVQIARECLWKVPQMQMFGFSDMQVKLYEMEEVLTDILCAWDDDVRELVKWMTDEPAVDRHGFVHEY